MTSQHPYYRKWLPARKDAKDFRGDGEFIDLTRALIPPSADHPVGVARALFDDRAAAAIRTAAALEGTAGLGPLRIWPSVALKPTTVHIGCFFKDIELRVPDRGGPWFEPRDMLELKYYHEKAPNIYIPRSKCLALLAYLDFFPNSSRIGLGLRSMVSRAVLAASPGWCGTFGPGVDGMPSMLDKDKEEGNYDMSEMHLLHMVYRHYDDVSPAAREHLIKQLLRQGRVHRPGSPESYTSGPMPNDWMRAGFVSPGGLQFTIGETENHILMITTARYLTNQLLFQRDRAKVYDNRRNDTDDSPSCFSLLLSLLRNMLRGDFSEYNAKGYQSETRWALLNLCTYAYDHEIRLAARMVLDYLSAHMAVSSNALRRLVPFRRRFEGVKVATSEDGFMDVGLLERVAYVVEPAAAGTTTLRIDVAGFADQHGIRIMGRTATGNIGRTKYVGQVKAGGRTTTLTLDPPLTEDVGAFDLAAVPDRGADPMHPYFAMQAGNIRAYEIARGAGRVAFAVPDNGTDLAMEVLSDYRIPPAIHDLFINDRSRRYFQRLHRTLRQEVGGNRNCDNMEIYASSPSYLITAGGSPATWAVQPGAAAFVAGEDLSQQLGAAVTTSFIPTKPLTTEAHDLIQFGHFSSLDTLRSEVTFLGINIMDLALIIPACVQNYGVAPDFACGPFVYLPPWLNEGNTEGVEDGIPQDPHDATGFSFANMGSQGDGPGFYLAIYQALAGDFAMMEVFDTWLHSDVTFYDFKHTVLQRNGTFHSANDVVRHYTTYNGNQIDFIIWSYGDYEHSFDLLPMKDGHHIGSGALITRIVYAQPDDADARGHAEALTPQLLSGTIMNSPDEGKIIITNPAIGTTIMLDFTDPIRPKRTDTQTGEIEFAGDHNEVWLDFEYDGPSEGDVCRPFNSIASAVAAVTSGGVIRVVPGATVERRTIGGGKHFKLVAPIGGVTIGGPDARPVEPESWGAVSNQNVWVQFDWPKTNQVDVPYLYSTLAEAVAAVGDGGVVNIEPGSTNERPVIGGKRFTLIAPIGDVTIGVR